MSNETLLNQAFDPASLEEGFYERWERENYFAPSGNGQPYSIAIPPPNVTGTLHIGHAFQQTLMDALVRYRRMCGNQTLWQTGTDHAGIATQMVVTEQLRAQGISINDLGREEFVNRVWRWRAESGGTITQQMRRLGASVDWTRERFTMDEGFSKAVVEVFVRLYEEELIYRGTRLVNWDPKLKTALSDLEVVTEMEPGHLWHLRYPLDARTTNEGKPFLVVATTRPETMLGDTAVAVHPDDERYAGLVGSSVVLPLVGRRIPVIADADVDPEFGTGCLKITPAHDFVDNEIGRRHNLDMVNILDDDARLNENVPEPYQNLDRFEARERVVQDLSTRKLLERVEEYSIQIPRGERSGEVVEPLMTKQWFVDIKPLAKEAVRVVEDGVIKFEPKRWENVYYSWMRDVRDWCISRQQWWGHRIPAWYDEDGNIYVGRTEEEARAKAGVADTVALVRDPDVLETWFSSALWTFGTLGWPDQTEDLEKFHPTSVLITGHDIIFFWVARMIMMTLKFTGEVPFKTVYITGLVRDAEGKKMSKTAGNGIDPLDLIDGIDLESLVAKRTSNLPQPSMAQRIELATRKAFPQGIKAYGTDALRMTFCSMASPGSTYNFQIKRLEGYHFFCNKLWNATKFVLDNTKDIEQPMPAQLETTDRWILSRLRKLIEDATRALNTFRFDLYANHVYEFAWHEFCDWYLELTKPRLVDSSEDLESRLAAQTTLLEVLRSVLIIVHPAMPFISEALWQMIPKSQGTVDDSIMLQAFPIADDFKCDPDADASLEWLKQVITAVRNIRGERSIAPKTPIRVVLSNSNERDRRLAAENESLIRRLGNASDVVCEENVDRLQGSIQFVNQLKIIVPFIDDADIEAERKRLSKELDRVLKDWQGVKRKLDNPNFVARAPEDIVQRQRELSETLSHAEATLREELAILPD